MSQRRLPVYLLVDTSGSMRGEPVQALNVALKALEQALRRDPFALETVHLSLIAFDLEVRELFPLTPLEQVRMPTIEVPGSGATFLGAALRLAVERVDRELAGDDPGRRGDWRPLLFVMTDGVPSDVQEYQRAVELIKSRPFGRIVACAAGPKAKIEVLRALTDNVVALDTLDGAGFSGFFQWVSADIAAHERAADDAPLPPPPDEIRV